MSSSGFFAGFLLGVAAGAVLGILCSPKSGDENREMLRERFPDLRERAPELINRAAEEVKTRIEEGQQAFRQGATETRKRMEGELDQARHSEGGTA
ncbi:MAG: YtxH-like protein [Chloroflexi bacterium]|nr:YtxH-like protein [Chloroflexota bacterium]